MNGVTSTHVLMALTAAMLSCVIVVAIAIAWRRRPSVLPLLPQELEGESEPLGSIAIATGDGVPAIVFTWDITARARAGLRKIPDVGGLYPRLSALMQALPSTLVAGAMGKSTLMEVVIKGELARAVDGRGYRAIALGPKGITNTARLFPADRMAALVDVSAVWQIASALVAQKHLADIDRKLERINTGMREVAHFLDDQRRARIQAAFRELQAAANAVAAGELSSSVRMRLDTIHGNTLEIFQHLLIEFSQRVDQPAVRDTWGTAEVTANITDKLRKLAALASDIGLCLQTRVATWYVLSLFPGETPLKDEHQRMLREDLDLVVPLSSRLRVQIEREVKEGLQSVFNTSAVLRARHDAIAIELTTALDTLTESHSVPRLALKTSAESLAGDDQPLRYVVKTKGGRIYEVFGAAT